MLHLQGNEYTILEMIKKMLILSMLVISTGCFGPSNKTQQGAGQGAILGGILGGVIGHQSGEAGKGALIGAGAGALLGGAIGNEEDKKDGKK